MLKQPDGWTGGQTDEEWAIDAAMAARAAEEHAGHIVNRAVAFAAKHHDGQVDKQNMPYILHPLRVMNRIAERFPEDSAMQVGAVLHDVVEDCGVTVEEIGDTFGAEVGRLVDALSRREAEETYAQYIERVKAHPKAIHVKIADLEDNTDLSRPGTSAAALAKIASLLNRNRTVLDALRKEVT